MKKVVYLFLLSITIAGCSAKEYEEKAIDLDDINNIKLDMSQEEVFEKLGKPKKVWSDDPFIKDELENAIMRNSLGFKLSSTESEYKDLKEHGERAETNENIDLYQYTYSNTYNDYETFLIWIDTNSKKVEYLNPRTLLDEDADITAEISAPTEKEEEIEQLMEPKEKMFYELGETSYFDNKSGDSVAVTVDSIDIFEGDDYNQPEGDYFIKIGFTIGNEGSEIMDISSHNFSAYDGDGNKMNMISKDFFSEEIVSGKKASGYAYFDAYNDGPFEIFFADTSWIVNN